MCIRDRPQRSGPVGSRLEVVVSRGPHQDQRLAPGSLDSTVLSHGVSEVALVVRPTPFDHRNPGVEVETLRHPPERQEQAKTPPKHNNHFKNMFGSIVILPLEFGTVKEIVLLLHQDFLFLFISQNFPMLLHFFALD